MKERILQKWIEVTGYFDHETDGEFVFDCELPEDGQEILVTLIGGAICRDICRIDKMGYHLESGFDWDDVFKWAPMPPAWWEENVPSRKGVFIPDITVEMFRNASLEGVEGLMESGEMEDISLPSAQPETHDKRTETHACDLISRQDAIDANTRAVER